MAEFNQVNVDRFVNNIYRFLSNKNFFNQVADALSELNDDEKEIFYKKLSSVNDVVEEQLLDNPNYKELSKRSSVVVKALKKEFGDLFSNNKQFNNNINKFKETLGVVAYLKKNGNVNIDEISKYFRTYLNNDQYKLEKVLDSLDIIYNGQLSDKAKDIFNSMFYATITENKSDEASENTSNDSYNNYIPVDDMVSILIDKDQRDSLIEDVKQIAESSEVSSKSNLNLVDEYEQKSENTDEDNKSDIETEVNNNGFENNISKSSENVSSDDLMFAVNELKEIVNSVENEANELEKNKNAFRDFLNGIENKYFNDELLSKNEELNDAFDYYEDCLEFLATNGAEIRNLFINKMKDASSEETFIDMIKDASRVRKDLNNRLAKTGNDEDGENDDERLKLEAEINNSVSNLINKFLGLDNTNTNDGNSNPDPEEYKPNTSSPDDLKNNGDKPVYVYTVGAQFSGGDDLMSMFLSNAIVEKLIIDNLAKTPRMVLDGVNDFIAEKYNDLEKFYEKCSSDKKIAKFLDNEHLKDMFKEKLTGQWKIKDENGEDIIVSQGELLCNKIDELNAYISKHPFKGNQIADRLNEIYNIQFDIKTYGDDGFIGDAKVSLYSDAMIENMSESFRNEKDNDKKSGMFINLSKFATNNPDFRDSNKYENADQIKSTLDRYYSIIDHSISNFDGKKRTFLEKEAYDKLQKVYKEHRLNIKNIAKDIGGIDGYSSKNIDELKVSNYNDYISSLDEHINNHKDDTDFNYNEMIDNYQNIVSSKGTMDQILEEQKKQAEDFINRKRTLEAKGSSR